MTTDTKTTSAPQWVEAPMGCAVAMFNGPDRADERRAAVKAAHKALALAGFTKGAQVKRHTPSQKLGRSEAYSGTYDQTRTPYTHPDGRAAEMIVSWSKYGEHRVAVHHKRNAQGGAR